MKKFVPHGVAASTDEGKRRLLINATISPGCKPRGDEQYVDLATKALRTISRTGQPPLPPTASCPLKRLCLTQHPLRLAHEVDELAPIAARVAGRTGRGHRSRGPRDNVTERAGAFVR